MLFAEEDIIYFRKLKDYLRLRVLAETGQKFTVIGGGFIGSENRGGARAEQKGRGDDFFRQRNL